MMKRADDGDRQLFEEAAAGFPRAFTRVVDVSVSPSRLAALALVLLNPEGEPYPMLVSLDYDAGAWNHIQATDVPDSYMVGSGRSSFSGERHSWVIEPPLSAGARMASARPSGGDGRGWRFSVVWSGA